MSPPGVGKETGAGDSTSKHHSGSKAPTRSRARGGLGAFGVLDLYGDVGEMAKQAINLVREDPRIASTWAIAALERELARDSNPHTATQDAFCRDPSPRLRKLKDEDAISEQIIQDIDQYFEEAGRCLREHDGSISGAETTHAIELLIELRRQRALSWLSEDMKHHILWHTRHDFRGNTLGAVASECDLFDYSYLVYRRASEAVNAWHNEYSRHHGYPPIFGLILSRTEFVDALEHRRRELRRLKKILSTSGSVSNVHWLWPKKWGSVGWNGPIHLRTPGCSWEKATISEKVLRGLVDSVGIAITVVENGG